MRPSSCVLAFQHSAGYEALLISYAFSLECDLQVAFGRLGLEFGLPDLESGET
jgi:hypothetical protein